MSSDGLPCLGDSDYLKVKRAVIGRHDPVIINTDWMPGFKKLAAS